MKDSVYLFAYGTLMSGFDGPYAKLLRDNADLLGEASCIGQLYRISFYPGLVLAGDRVVYGELYRLRLPTSEKLLQTLDEYEGVDDPERLEGDEYARRLIDVGFKGRTLTAWTYIYTGKIAGRPIEGGRFFSTQSSE